MYALVGNCVADLGMIQLLIFIIKNSLICVLFSRLTRIITNEQQLRKNSRNALFFCLSYLRVTYLLEVYVVLASVLVGILGSID